MLLQHFYVCVLLMADIVGSRIDIYQLVLNCRNINMAICQPNSLTAQIERIPLRHDEVLKEIPLWKMCGFLISFKKTQ